MKSADIDLDFDPPNAADLDQEREWRQIIAGALSTRQGNATLRFVRREDEWILQALLWSRPGEPFLAFAPREHVQPLCETVVGALAAAGKRVRMEV